MKSIKFKSKKLHIKSIKSKSKKLHMKSIKSKKNNIKKGGNPSNCNELILIFIEILKKVLTDPKKNKVLNLSHIKTVLERETIKNFRSFKEQIHVKDFLNHTLRNNIYQLENKECNYLQVKQTLIDILNNVLIKQNLQTEIIQNGKWRRTADTRSSNFLNKPNTSENSGNSGNSGFHDVDNRYEIPKPMPVDKGYIDIGQAMAYLNNLKRSSNV